MSPALGHVDWGIREICGLCERYGASVLHWRFLQYVEIADV